MDLAGFFSFLFFFFIPLCEFCTCTNDAGSLLFFAGLITWALFFLFCLSNGYRARRQAWGFPSHGVMGQRRTRLHAFSVVTVHHEKVLGGR